jgi:folate-dependent phosphoribosylglycinamide formyltransferase PurN
MKIYIIVSDDVIFKPRVLYRLLQRKGNDVCGVAEVKDRKTKKNKSGNQPTNIQFLGIKGFLVFGFYNRFLRILKFFPLPSFIKSRLSNKNVCSFFKAPYEYIYDANDPRFISGLSSLEPDIIISCQRQMFSEDLLSVAKIACINCHPAKLPKYRGLNPVFAAMIDGEDTIGVTVHTMTREIDKGAIICQKEFATSREYSLMDNYALAHELYSDVIIESLDLIEKKGISDFPFVPDDAPYYKRPSLEDVKKFRASGLKMI